MVHQHERRRGQVGSGRRRDVAGLGRAVLVGTVLAAGAPLLATVLAVPSAVPAGATTSPPIATVAGGTRPGPAPGLSTSIQPSGVVVRENVAYVGDVSGNVVRAIDLTTGDQHVVVGDGGLGFSGDGGPATAAQLRGALGLAVDGAGDLYLADSANARIRKVDTNGTITTVAGSATAGFGGDGGPATAAQLQQPTGIAVDGAGNLYIADLGNSRIRKVDAGGTITTFAGTGAFSFSGDGGPATAAALNAPAGVAVDGSGNVFIADTNNQRLRRVDGGGTITTIAGTGSPGTAGDGGPATAAQLSSPNLVAVDGTGAVLVADQISSRIRRVVPGGNLTTVAGTTGGYSGDGGPATAAQLASPFGVAVSATGELVITDAANERVRRVTAGGTITTLAGNGKTSDSGDGGLAAAAQLNAPFGVAADGAGNLVESELGNARVRRIDTNGGITALAGSGVPGFSGDGGPATAAALSFPEGVALGPGGVTYIADAGNNRIRKVDAGGTITTFAGGGPGGSFSGDGGPATSATLDLPSAVAVDGSGNVFIADYNNHRIRKVDTGGTITTVAGNGIPTFGGDGGPATSASLKNPDGVAVDGAGNLYIADDQNHRIRKVDTGGTITTIAGTGAAGFSGDGGPATAAQLSAPAGLAVGGGKLYVADYGNGRIRVISGGTITTLAGNGGYGFTGDGGPADAATLASATSVAVDGSGVVHLADYGNNRVRRVGARPGAGFHPVTPFRAVDTRIGLGLAGPLGPGQSAAATLAPLGAVPAGASGVIMNVTATGGTAASYLTAYPAGGSVPNAANLLFAPNETVPNLVTVGVGAGGQVAFFNQLGTVHVVADVVGWFDDGSPGGSLFNAVTPTRLLDSRTFTGGWSKAPLGPGEARDVVVAGQAGVSGSATAVVMNVTVTGGTSASYLQAYPSGAAQPLTANLLFAPGQTVPNLVTVGIGGNGKVTLFNQQGSVHVVADVVGYFDGTGARFHAVAPTRMLDSRNAGPSPWTGTPLPADATRTLAVAPGVPATATGLVANVTVTGGTAASYLSVSPTPGLTPAPTANLLFAAGQTVPNAVMVGIGTGNGVDLFNQLGSVHVVVDADGYYAAT